MISEEFNCWAITLHLLCSFKKNMIPTLLLDFWSFTLVGWFETMGWLETYWVDFKQWVDLKQQVDVKMYIYTFTGGEYISIWDGDCILFCINLNILHEIVDFFFNTYVWLKTTYTMLYMTKSCKNTCICVRTLASLSLSLDHRLVAVLVEKSMYFIQILLFRTS